MEFTCNSHPLSKVLRFLFVTSLFMYYFSLIFLQSPLYILFPFPFLITFIYYFHISLYTLSIFPLSFVFIIFPFYFAFYHNCYKVSNGRNSMDLLMLQFPTWLFLMPLWNSLNYITSTNYYQIPTWNPLYTKSHKNLQFG